MRTPTLRVVLSSAFALAAVSSAPCEPSGPGQPPSDPAVVSDEHRAAAAAILEARRNSVELILRGQPAPYYLVGPLLPPAPSNGATTGPSDKAP
jgi:hypothetical protein